MSLQVLRELSSIASTLATGGWNPDELSRLSLAAPTVAAGFSNEQVLRADHALNDAVWRALSLVDPLRFPDERYRFAHVFKSIMDQVVGTYPIHADEAMEIAKPLAAFLVALSKSFEAQRVPVSRSDRMDVVSALGDETRCWYCGYLFSSDSISKFLGGNRVSGTHPPYIDFVTMRGKNTTDLRPELDHIVPASIGGESAVANLRLACGWCNRNKGALRGIYDTAAFPVKYRHPNGQLFALPRPYWVVRVLASIFRAGDALA